MSTTTGGWRRGASSVSGGSSIPTGRLMRGISTSGRSALTRVIICGHNQRSRLPWVSEIWSRSRRMEPIWQVEYEESPLSELWVYKHDTGMIADGTWRRLNSVSKAQYRVEGDRLQLVSPESEIADADWRTLLDSLAQSAFMTDE